MTKVFRPVAVEVELRRQPGFLHEPCFFGFHGLEPIGNRAVCWLDFGTTSAVGHAFVTDTMYFVCLGRGECLAACVLRYVLTSGRFLFNHRVQVVDFVPLCPLSWWIPILRKALKRVKYD